jgi:hypothetical protein
VAVVITAGAETVEPHLVLAGAVLEDAPNTIEHVLLDGSSLFKYVPPGAPKITRELFFLDEATARAARADILAVPTFDYADSDNPADDGTLILIGSPTALALDPNGRRRWTFRITTAVIA